MFVKYVSHIGGIRVQIWTRYTEILRCWSNWRITSTFNFASLTMSSTTKRKNTNKSKRAIHKSLIPTWPPNASPTWPCHRNATLHMVYRNMCMLVDLASEIGIGHCTFTNLNKNHAQQRTRAIHRILAPNWPSKCTNNTTISCTFKAAHRTTKYQDFGPIGIAYRPSTLQTYPFEPKQIANENVRFTTCRLQLDRPNALPKIPYHTNSHVHTV